MKTITDYFERAAAANPSKAAVSDESVSLTYSELMGYARSIGTKLGCCGKRKSAVALFLDKTPFCAAAMLGTAYSGNFYIVVDSKMPAERIKTMFSTVSPFAVITQPELVDTLKETGFDGDTYIIDEIIRTDVDDELLKKISTGVNDREPLYCLFTSGSTGVPKGTVVSHGNVIAYTDWFINRFDITNETVFGSQTPFYFSMSVTDLFSTLRTGAELAIIPKKFFAFPIKLIQYLNDKKVNTIYWVPSALCIVANSDLFKYAKPEYLKKVLFAGEVMPVKQLNYWISHFPDIIYANLFGPTETTDICTYYVVDRSFEDSASLPIGNACDNCSVFVLGEDGKECAAGEEGELYVRGPFVAYGYYNNPEKTKEAFVQDPLNDSYPELVYKTGDIVKYNEYGELIYCGRKDHQIKHMGYRIELGEIENAATACEGVLAAACIYNSETDRIIMIYQGKPEEKAVLDMVRKRVPEYMVPGRVIKISSMPHNSNGKIDRVLLKNTYKDN